jgi:hypothetical protein
VTFTVIFENSRALWAGNQPLSALIEARDMPWLDEMK